MIDILATHDIFFVIIFSWRLIIAFGLIRVENEMFRRWNDLHSYLSFQLKPVLFKVLRIVHIPCKIFSNNIEKQAEETALSRGSC